MSVAVIRRERQGVIPDGVAGMLLFIATEAMFFTGLISAFVIVRAGTGLWPPPGQPRLPVLATAMSTSVLLASGVVLFLADRAWVEEPARVRKRLAWTMALGSFFVLFQGSEWARLIAYGLTMTSSPYGSFFYLIVGAHALHAVGALGGLAWASQRHAAGGLSRDAFRAVQLFWYFVVGVWPILYGLVYLA